jgi:two-component system, OmpR family, sensor histidine kinase BaeS
MMRSLAFKLIVAFLAVSLTGSLLLALLGGWRTAGEFGQFVVQQEQELLVEELTAYYEREGSWAGIQNRRFGGHMSGMGQMHGHGLLGPFALADADGRIIIPAAGFRPGQQVAATTLSQGAPIRVEERVVGTLVVDRTTVTAMSASGQQFLGRVYRWLIVAGAGATAVALVLGIMLARALTDPLKELTNATRAVAEGHFDQQVPVHANDELGQLAQSFNQMNANLKQARDLRRQMTADIAHDLRTPLSIILGHAEALRDGVLPVTPETLSLIHEEALQLNRLVDDLRTLSLAEAGELPLLRRPTAPHRLLEHAATTHNARAQRQNVSLQTSAGPDLPLVNVDADRIGQVFNNLLDNALRHTPPGGRIDLTTERHNGTVRFQISDSGSGIAPADLRHIFERSYRVDKSRARYDEEQHSRGSGLGLAIARSIVETHNGRIWVESTPGQGTSFFIELPAV